MPARRGVPPHDARDPTGSAGATVAGYSGHPFVLTGIIGSLIGGIGKHAIKQRDLPHFVLVLMLVYGGLPAAFIIDCCISLPLSLMLAITRVLPE
jgi:hypothetical protein